MLCILCTLCSLYGVATENTLHILRTILTTSHTEQLSVMFKMLSSTLPWENDSSDDESLLLFSLNNNNKQKRKWIHEVNMERKKFGEFHYLLKQLLKDELKFKEYFRMSMKQFDQLLSIIKKDIEKKKLNLRESIPAEER